MAFFISAEQRLRNQATDLMIETTRSVVTDPAVVEALPEISAEQLDLIDNHFFVPNVKHGEVMLPKSIKNPDAIPVVSVYGNEKLELTLPLYTPTERQLTNMLTDIQSQTNGGSSLQATEKSRDLLRRHFTKSIMQSIIADEDLTIPFEASVEGSVFTRTTGLKITPGGTNKPLEAQAFYRPVVLYPIRDPVDDFDATTGLHENMHVIHTLNKGLLPNDGKEIIKHHMQSEFEAIYTEVVAARALYAHSPQERFRGSDDLFDDYLIDAENFFATESIGPHTNFEITPSLQTRIKQLGFQSIATLADKVE